MESVETGASQESGQSQGDGLLSSTESQNVTETGQAGTQNAEQAQAQAQATQQKTSLGWRAALHPDLQNHEVLSKFKGPNDLAKEYLAAAEKAKNALPRLTETSTDEDKAAYRKAIGVPDKAEDYDIPEELAGVKLDKEALVSYKEALHQMGVPAEAAKGLVEWRVKADLERESARQAGLQRQVEATTKAFKTEWGPEFQGNLDRANRYFHSVFPDDVRGALAQAGITAHPSFIKAMYEGFKKSGMGEDGLVRGQGGSEKRKSLFDHSKSLGDFYGNS